MTKKYNFRIRFNVASRLYINTDEPRLFLLQNPKTYDVYIKPGREKTFRTANKLSITGGPFDTKQEAEREGKKWREIAEVSFAYMGLAVDFGDRAPQSYFTDAGLEERSEFHRQRALNDIHGLDVYEAHPEPVFVSAAVNLKVGIPADTLVEVVHEALKKGVSNNDAERLAYDLYSASFDLMFSDARFLTLMMAVETLAVRRDREDETVSIINNLRETAKKWLVVGRERDAILGALKDLKLQSISEACRELVSPLNKLSYSSVPPDEFITKCYRLRSKLVHGSNPRPSREEVDSLVAGLEILVSHLLSHKLGRVFRDTGATKENTP